MELLIIILLTIVTYKIAMYIINKFSEDKTEGIIYDLGLIVVILFNVINYLIRH